MELYTQANGSKISVMASEASYGKMEPNLKECGKTIRQMEMALSGMSQETFTKEIGSKIDLTVLESILIKAESSMKVFGKTTFNMVKA